MNTITIPGLTPELRAFLRELLHDAGQNDLGEELEDMMIVDLYSRLEDRLILTAMSKLSMAKQRELEKMAEKKTDSAKIQEFLQKNIKDYQKVFAVALEEFRNLYIQASK